MPPKVRHERPPTTLTGPIAAAAASARGAALFPAFVSSSATAVAAVVDGSGSATPAFSP